ncbi:Na+/H+ antiporter NhaA [Edaphovirga cremea]|uniref:Na+/H+ antiporter NhaA n=1 Tax=Edaphovirga cremea TaxID=2267246 RepID=UPI0039896E6F
MNNLIRQFLRMEASGGIVLIIAAIIALFMANTSLNGFYHSILDLPVSLKIAALDISKPLLLWINDGFMALFFLIVGLEVKRELLDGSLAGREKAVFPAVAALGGMIAPALIFLLFNGGDEVARHGWAIPAATDIAFAVGVLALLGQRVPLSLKVFLLALAIIDDLGAIVIIALFYTAQVSMTALGMAAAAIVLLAYMNWRGVSRISLYILVGIFLWVCVLKSGVHATLAGVILGFFIPLNRTEHHSPSRKLEHGLHPWVSWLILPLFAFANAGIDLRTASVEGLTSMVPLGIAAGLMFGKPLGITLFCWLSVKLRLAALPTGVTFKQIMATSVLCGIGFTMSIFIASLAFEHADPELIVYSKVGILGGSILSAIAGYFLLKRALPARHLA